MKALLFMVKRLFPSKGAAARRTGRHKSPYASLSLEGLEQRALMTADPLLDMTQLFAVESPVYTQAAEVCAVAGDQVKGLMVLDLQNLGGKTLTPGNLTLTGTGSTPLNKVASALNVYVDGNRNGNLFDEAPIMSLGLGSNRVVVNMTHVFEQYGANSHHTVGFGLQTKPTLASAVDIGLDVEKIEALNAQGKKLRASDITLLDMNGSMVHVVPQNNMVSLSVSGPAMDQIEKGQQNVVMGVIHVSTTQGEVNFGRLSVGLEARDVSGKLTAQVGQELNGVELYNTRTGQLVAGTLHSQGNGYQVFKFANMSAKDGDSLIVRADSSNHSSVQTGDRYRILVEATETNNSTTTLAGLLPKAVKGLDANIVDVDSKRNVTVVYPQGTLAGGFVSIGQTSMNVVVQYIASADTAVANQKDLTFVRFQILGRGGDVSLTEATFAAEQGNLLNGQNYRLFADTDGNGNVDQPIGTAFVQNGRLVFADIVGGGYIIGKDQVVTFELRGDATSSLLQDNVLQVKLDSVTGEKVANGAPVQTSLSSVPSTVWTFVKQGNLYVTSSITPIRSHQLLGGTLSDPVMAITVRGDGEPIDLTKLAVQTLGSYAQSVDRIEMFLVGAVSLFAIMTEGATGSDPVPSGSRVYTANMQNHQLVIAEGHEETILLRARMKTDDQGGISGELVQFQLLRVEARGIFSSNNLLVNDGDGVREGEVFVGTNGAGANAPVVSTKHVVVMSKITAIVNANPDADNTNVPTGVSPIGQFRFSAAANYNTLNGINRSVLSGVILTVNVQNVEFDASAMFLYNKADSMTKVLGQVYDANVNRLLGPTVGNGTYYVVFTGLDSSALNTQVVSGGSTTLVLQSTITKQKVDPTKESSLQVSLDQFNDPMASSMGLFGNHVLWFDTDVFSRPLYGIEYSDTVVRSTKYRS